MFNLLFWFDVVVSFNSFDDRTSAEGLENFKKNNKNEALNKSRTQNVLCVKID